MSSPNTGTDYVQEGQNAGEITLNDFIDRFDAIVHLAVQSVTNTPPGSPVKGQRWLVVATATGAWTGQEGNIAAYYNGWVFITPKAGWTCWDKNLLQHMTYDGVNWIAFCNNIAAIASPGTATATDCANKINSILTAMKSGGIMKPD